jgi:hypothetical protein
MTSICFELGNGDKLKMNIQTVFHASPKMLQAVALLLSISACSEFMYRPTIDDFHKSYIFQIMEHRKEARRQFESGSISQNKIDKPIWAFQKVAEDSSRGETVSWFIDTFSHGSYSPWGTVQREDGTYCRSISETVSVNRNLTTRQVVACRTGKAPWRWEPLN